MALQPCAMALGEASEPDCPNCPPAHTSGMSMPGSHEVEDAAASISCGSKISQCVFGDEVSVDGRSVKVKDSPDHTPVGIAPFIAALPVTSNLAISLEVDGLSYLPCAPQALNVLYCVYLI